MERGFGGPVWHASVRINGNHGAAWLHAERALLSVGDAALGEWREQTDYTVQLRRRLTMQEQLQYGIELRDIRGTDEERNRLDMVFDALPPQAVAMFRSLKGAKT
jgi:hypothetical protein